MKKRMIFLCVAIAAAIGCPKVQAQYYDMANQVSNMVQTAVLGGLNYKGIVEAEYVQGFGNNQVNFINLTTTQGFRYSTWFFMGAGAGVDIAMSHVSNPYNGDRYGASTVKTGVMVPLFTDFRFTIGSENSVAFNLGLKLGGIFLLSDSYLEVNNGYISNREYFYLRPAAGVRIPVNSQNPKQAVSIGLSYQLIAANDFWYWGGPAGNSTSLNGVGVNFAYEW